MAKPSNKKLKLPDSPRPAPYSETQQAIAQAWERKKAMLAKFRAEAGRYQ